MRELVAAERAWVTGLKASPSDFDCLPLSAQVQHFVGFLFDRGDTAIQPEDLVGLFTLAAMVSPRSGKPVSPSSRDLGAALDALVKSGKVPFVPGPQGYQLPWHSLSQHWTLAIDAGNKSKAERLAQRTNQTIRGPYPFVPRFQPAPDGLEFEVSTPLVSVAWPCAVAEALRNGLGLSPWWRYRGDAIPSAEAFADKATQSGLVRAAWRIEKHHSQGA